MGGLVRYYKLWPQGRIRYFAGRNERDTLQAEMKENKESWEIQDLLGVKKWKYSRF